MLTKDLQGPKSLTYLCRGNEVCFVITQLDITKQTCHDDLPNLSHLRNLSLVTRKRILTITLGIKEFALDSYPNEWRLYIGTIIFWMSQQQKLGTICHLYSLLFAMLFGIVDKKIGYQRSEQYFRKKYGQQVKTILNHRMYQKQFGKSTLIMNKNLTIYQAFCDVTEDDCLLVAPFLLSNFEIDYSLFPVWRKFNVSIVHAFAQFQICLSHCLHLNALLGNPFEKTKISEMFNGTLIYNLYNNFKKSSDVDAYVFHQLKNAPSLLRLFSRLLYHVKILLKTDVLETLNMSQRFDDEWRDFVDNSD